MNLDLFGEIARKFPHYEINRYAVLIGVSYGLVLCGLFAAKACFRARRKTTRGEPLLAIAGSSQNAEVSTLDGAIAREAADTGAPAASLRTIQAKLRELGVPAAEIPDRLRESADSLARLQAQLRQEDSGAPVFAPLRADALACLARGDLGAAAETLAAACAKGPPGCEDAEARAEIYLLAAAIDHLRLDYRAAAEKYAAAEALFARRRGEGESADKEWRLRMARGQELSRAASELGDRRSFGDSIEAYKGALGLVVRAAAPLDWAATQFHLGNACLAFGLNERDAERMEEAVDAYLAALEEWTRERAPFDWAKTQNNLGVALLMLGEGDGDADRLRPAIEAYRAALQEWTRESAPSLWAMAQANLGDALEALGKQSGGGEELQQAVAAYEAALEGAAADLAPSRLAATNAGLGDALLAIGAQDGESSTLEKAASAYRAALAAQDQGEASLETAKIQINLAYALGSLWSQTRNRQIADEALAIADAAISAIKGCGAKQDLRDAERARKALRATLAGA